MKETRVDVDIWLPIMKTLVKKYGNFKISQDLHNYIIENLACICDAIEQENPKEQK